MNTPTQQVLENGSPELYTSKEVCIMFKISRPTLANWASKQIFKKIKIPGQRRVYFSGQSVRAALTGVNK